jgi:hypothetical protein
LFFFFVLIFKDDCFPRVSQFVVEKFSVREREDEKTTTPLQEEVVKSQSALHVARFGSTLAKIFWLEALWHHSAPFLLIRFSFWGCRYLVRLK